MPLDALAERASRWFDAGALRVQAQKGDMTGAESPQVESDEDFTEPRNQITLKTLPAAD